MFLKIKPQQGPEERTFLAGWLHEEAVVESRGNLPNFRRDNLFDSLLRFLAAHLSKAGGRLEFGVRNLFGSLALAIRRLERLCFRGLNTRGRSLVDNRKAAFRRSSPWSIWGSSRTAGNSNSGYLQFATRVLRVERLIPAGFGEYTIYPPLVLHQALIRLVLIHGIFTDHKIHSLFDVEHEIIGALVVPQFNTELRKRNFLCCPVNIEVRDLIWGSAIRDRPDSGSNKFFNNVAASKDSAGEVKCIFAAPDSNCPMIIVHSVYSSQGFDR
jgi:hypothetical protein